MDITAQLNNLRIAPRKTRALTKLVKGLDIERAKANLRYISNRSSFPLIKLIDSAAANASNNFGLEKDTLYVKDIIVNEGVKLKRFMPKAMGMVNPIQKKTSRIKIVLDKMPEEKIKQIRSSKKGEAGASSEERASRARSEGGERSEVPSESKVGSLAEQESKADEREIDFGKKPEIKKEFAKGSKKPKFEGVKSIGRKLFRRKSIG